MAKITTISVATEDPTMSDVTFKEGKKFFIIRLTKAVTDKFKIGQKIPTEGLEKLKDFLPLVPMSDTTLGSKVLLNFKDAQNTKHPLQKGANGIACPVCGNELVDGAKDTCRISKDGPVILVTCSMCGFSKQRLI